MVAREVSASRLHSNTTTSTSGGPANPLHQLPPPPHAAAVGLRHTSSSGSGSGSFGADDIGLQRASSMNLPKPEDSGVPATHPDMCILRIRRNHLVEVRALVLERGAKQTPSCLWKFGNSDVTDCVVRVSVWHMLFAGLGLHQPPRSDSCYSYDSTVCAN